jgi:hypothetical protein
MLDESSLRYDSINSVLRMVKQQIDNLRDQVVFDDPEVLQQRVDRLSRLVDSAIGFVEAVGDFREIAVAGNRSFEECGDVTEPLDTACDQYNHDNSQECE